MKKLTVIAAVIILALPILALAQEEAETDKNTSSMERIRKAAELIKTSNEAREAGIPEEEVTEVLEGARKRGLSTEETQEVLAESTAAIEESGPIDNFGAFVQAKLDEGLRGRELAAAIHEEHRQQGKGKGHGKHEMKEEKHKGHKGDKKGRHVEGDQDHDGDEDEEDHDDDQGEGHGKSGKKGKGGK
ncbi:MAG: hypothetical protein KAH56_02070 [Candidatus Krumholzibacteria bacterium]|nr:hypothetical protein [Candidatus Krumholzibacteria bacterium]